MSQVYVDVLIDWGWRLRGWNTKSCHMFVEPGTDLEILHEMATKIGMKRQWFQNKAGKTPHYDLVPKRRAAAVELGAKELSIVEAGAIFRKWRTEPRK